MPRAIKFCAALYSLGLPPEMLGLSALSEKELDVVRDCTASYDQDMADALMFYNEDNLSILPSKIQEEYKKAVSNFSFESDNKHKTVTKFIMQDFKKNNLMSITENIEI